jgi:hypothetical protein
MTVQAECDDRERLRATTAELQTMADLIAKYPAEAQLIMAALEDGLTLGPMQAADEGCPDPVTPPRARPASSG